MQNDEATENVWDLLYDYCNFHEIGYLSEIRDIDHKTFDDFMGYTVKFPMGESFLLNIYSKKRFMVKSNEVNIQINAKDVLRLIGCLKKFIVVGRNLNLYCGENLQIAPSS